MISVSLEEYKSFGGLMKNGWILLFNDFDKDKKGMDNSIEVIFSEEHHTLRYMKSNKSYIKIEYRRYWYIEMHIGWKKNKYAKLD